MKFKNLTFVKKWPYVASIFGAIMFLPNRVLAISFITEAIGEIFWSFYVYPAIWFLNLELELLKLVARYNNFTHEGGVTLGWIALRDLSNMFFILIFLVIAFATILRISSYGYQQLLRRTILIAILINFSKTIVGFVIDVAQVIMLTFVSAVNEILTGGVVVAIGLHKFTTIRPFGNDIGFLDYIVSLVMGGLLVLILIVVIGIMLMMLMMRIVALWMAVIMSPLAFLANVFPATRPFYNTWLRQLGSNLVTGPMLAFFLWLTFTIVGNGNAYTSFMNSETSASVSATEFLGTTNLVNYIIAISLLLMGAKIASSSGGAGANFAAKGTSFIQTQAGRLARRYPGALGQRVVAGFSRSVIDQEGNFKDNRVARFTQGISNVPFYGGKIQRGLMQMQGRSAARITQERSEDEKYILPQHRVAFEKTYAAGAQSKRTLRNVPVVGKPAAWVAKTGGWFIPNVPGLRNVRQAIRGAGEAPAGKIYSKVGSWGGDTEREAMMYQNLLARGEINSNNADAATEALRRIGDEEGMQRIQANYWTFANKDEAMRLIEKNGLNGILGSVKSDNLFEDKVDANGNVIKDPQTGQPEKDFTRPKESAKYAIDALFDPRHGEADHNAITAKILANNKMDRWLITEIMQKHFDWGKYLDREKGSNSFAVPSEGIEPDKRGILDNNLGNPAVVAAQVLAKVYPQKLGDRIDAEGNIERLGVDRFIQARAYLDLKDAPIKPGQIGQRLYQWHFEDDKTFHKRKNLADDLDRINRGTSAKDMPDWVKDHFHYIEEGQDRMSDENWEKFQATRKDLYQQVLGLKSWTFDPIRGKRTGNYERVDYHDSDTILGPNSGFQDRESALKFYAMEYVLPETARRDLLSKKDSLAKENEETFNRRKEIFSKTEAPEEYERRYRRKLAELEAIDRLNINELAPGFINQFGIDAANEVKKRMMAEIVGDNRKSHNWASKSFWTEVQDGAHGSRLMEVNTGNSHEAAMLDHALDASENQQQSQAFQVATPEQTAYMLNKLVELGKQPQKVLMENTPKALAAEAQQKLDDIKAMQKGLLPDDLAVLGPDLRRIANVLQSMAKDQKITMAEFLEKPENSSIKKMVDGLNDYFKDSDASKNVELDYKNNVFHYLGIDHKLDELLPKDPLNVKDTDAEKSYRVNADVLAAEKAKKAEKEQGGDKKETAKEETSKKPKIITENLEEEFRNARNQNKN